MKTKYFFLSALIISVFTLSIQGWASPQNEVEELNDFFSTDPETSSDSIGVNVGIWEDEYENTYMVEDDDTILRMAVVLSDIYSKKDLEFSRGMLLGMQESSLPDNSISLKIINGDIPQDSLYNELMEYDPHLVISTYEKNHPYAVTSFASRMNKKFMTVFDAKNDSYVRNQGAYQVLVPSDAFNENITKFFMEKHGNDYLVMVGDPDLNDLMLRNLIVAWPEEKLLILTKTELPRLLLEENENYIFLPVSLNATDIKGIMSEIDKLKTSYPSSEILILGRPNWISFTDLNSIVEGNDVYIPAKCYFDPSSDSGKRLIASYKEAYGHSPIKSFPTYAVMGYDVAKYFLPYLVYQHRGDEIFWMPDNMVQSYFDIRQKNNAGFYNGGSLMLHYRPWGAMQKLTVN